MADPGKRNAYLGLIFVIFIWGISPLVTLYFYNYFSPTVRISMSAFVGGIAMLLISKNKLNLLNKEYFKIAIPTGICLTVANILQKIGLQYTTPTHYAFLENLSVISVPVILFLVTRKRPTFLTISSAFLCLVSSAFLTGIFSRDGKIFWTGDILCALAGIFYGINIAITGTYAKKFSVSLYLMLQILTEAILSFISAIVLDITGVEKILFTPDVKIISLNILFILMSSTLGWLIRTNSMRKIKPTVVAVMMPFSSIVTTFTSIISGKDTLSLNLILAIVLGTVAVILSGIDDKATKKE